MVAVIMMTDDNNIIYSILQMKVHRMFDSHITLQYKNRQTDMKLGL